MISRVKTKVVPITELRPMSKKFGLVQNSVGPIEGQGRSTFLQTQYTKKKLRRILISLQAFPMIIRLNVMTLIHNFEFSFC